MTEIKPEWMSEEAIETLSRGYLLPGETPLGMFSRVATAVEKYIPELGLSGDLFDCLWKGLIGLASPVASNFGASRGLPISCYALSISDDLHSIYSHLKEAAALSKYGGGVGAYFGNIRCSGSAISNGGKSSGVVPWMREYDLSSANVSQGATRRGSYALYLPIDHPDLLELLRCKDHAQGDPRSFIDSNIAVTITDKFLEEMLQGDVHKKELFSRVLELRMISGSPYIVFIDNVNNQNPDCYKSRGLKVTTSNLCCLMEHELVETKEGPKQIKDLVGKSVEIWDGQKWIVVDSFEKKGETNTMIEIEFEDGSTDYYTEGHRIPFTNPQGETFFLTAEEVFDLYKLNLPLRDVLVHNKSKPQNLLEQIFGKDKIVEDYKLRGRIRSVEKLRFKDPEEKVPVFCCTVPTTGMFALANGRMTGNSEITLYTDENHTFVCVLSSFNLLKWDEIKTYRGPNTGKTVPELMVYLLDAVCEEFIVKASRLPSMGRAVRFAKKSRALGAGTMGLAALYQSKGLAFKSSEARQLNIEVHKFIYENAKKASAEMAKTYGEPEWCEGSGFRHTHLIAIAPTRTNSVISGAISQGIEPLESNLFIAKQAKGSFVRRNPFLEKLLEEKGRNTDEVWDSLIQTRGSVQHLDFLTEDEKNIFLTAREIDQLELIHQAAERQKYVCQAQSLNLFIEEDTSADEIWSLHLVAWYYGLKSLYYLRSSSKITSRATSIEAYDNIIVTKSGCPYCEKAKLFMQRRGIPFVEMTKDKAISVGYYRQDWGTFPQIYIDKNFIGGHDQLLEYFDQIIEQSSEGCVACEG